MSSSFRGFGFPFCFPSRAAEHSKIPKAALLWDNANDEAKEQAGGIEEAIEFAQFNVDQVRRWDASKRISFCGFRRASLPGIG